MPNSCDMTNRIVIGGKHFLHAWRCSARAACAWPVARPSRWTVARKLTAQRAVMLTVSWTQHTVRTGLCQLDAAGGCLDGRPVFIYLFMPYLKTLSLYTGVRGVDKSLARSGRKLAQKHVRDARDFNIETRAGIKFFFPCKVRCRRKFTPFWQKC